MQLPPQVLDIITDSDECEDTFCLVDDRTEFKLAEEPLNRDDDDRANEVGLEWVWSRVGGVWLDFVYLKALLVFSSCRNFWLAVVCSFRLHFAITTKHCVVFFFNFAYISHHPLFHPNIPKKQHTHTHRWATTTWAAAGGNWRKSASSWSCLCGTRPSSTRYQRRRKICVWF